MVGRREVVVVDRCHWLCRRTLDLGGRLQALWQGSWVDHTSLLVVEVAAAVVVAADCYMPQFCAL